MLRSSDWILMLGFACGCAIAAERICDEIQVVAFAEQSRGEQSATASSVEQSTSAPPVDSPPAQSAALPDPLGEARAFVRSGNLDAALEKYRQLLVERPKSPDAYAGLTRVYLKKKDVIQAYETVTKGLQVTDAWPLHVALGEVYFRQGKIFEAESEWVTVINSGHQAARAYFGLANVRWALSMNKSARAMIEKAHALDPKDPDIKKDWISTLSRRERVKNLEEYLASAGKDDPDRAATQRYLDYLKLSAGSDLRCTLVGKVASTEITMVRMLTDPETLGGYGLSVAVNGQKGNLLLDTGASGILINRGLAERAGVTKIAETRIRGIGDQGSKSGYLGLARSVRIGDLEFTNCPVRVLDSRSVAGGSGLIGTVMFQEFLVDIDFPIEKLRLRELPKRPNDTEHEVALTAGEEAEGDDNREDDAGDHSEKASSRGPQDRYIAPEMKSYTLVYRFGHELLVPTKVGDAPPKLFLLDTGAVDNMISSNAAREVTKVGRDDSTVKGISGSVKKVYSARKAVLQFGRLLQENQDMLAFDLSSLSDDAGTEISGTLGFTMLRLLELKIDYRDGLVDFNYEPKRLIHF